MQVETHSGLKEFKRVEHSANEDLRVLVILLHMIKGSLGLDAGLARKIPSREGLIAPLAPEMAIQKADRILLNESALEVKMKGTRDLDVDITIGTGVRTTAVWNKKFVTRILEVADRLSVMGAEEIDLPRMMLTVIICDMPVNRSSQRSSSEVPVLEGWLLSVKQ